MNHGKKILIIILYLFVHTSSHAFAQENLSPAINLSNQAFQEIIQNSIQPKQAEPFLKKRPLDWGQKRRIPRHWPKRIYDQPEFTLEKTTEHLMVYPENLLNSPDMFEHLDQSDTGIAFDMNHYQFNYDTGYWHSKDFPKLILGTWQDVQKKFTKNEFDNSRSKMKYHVVTRFKRPDNTGTISFYYFDSHAYSVPYALEAKARNELPDGADHIIVDQHSDGLKTLDFPIPQTLKEWQELVKSNDISMNNFHSVFGRLKMFSRLFWIFDKDSDHPSRKKAGKDLEKYGNGAEVRKTSMQKYPLLKTRPQQSKALVNFDVDAIDQMIGIKEYELIEDYPRTVSPREALSFFTDFLLQLTKHDQVDIRSFHASTTNYHMRDDGDVETTRFLSRIAPIIILNSKTSTLPDLRFLIDQTTADHAYKLTLGPYQKERLLLRFQESMLKGFEIDESDDLIDQSI